MIKEKNNRFNYIFFLIFYTLYCVKSGWFSLAISESFFISLKDILNIVLLFLLLLSILLLNCRKKQIFLILFMVFSFVNIFIFNNKSYFGYLFIVSLMIYASTINWNILIKIIILANILTILSTTMMTPFSDYYFLFDDRFGERFTGGLDNPNTLGQYSLMFFNSIALYLESKNINTRSKLPIVTIVFSFTLAVLYLTYSRTSLYLCISLYILFLFSLLKKQNSTLQNRLLIKKVLVLTSIFFIALQFFFISFFKDISVLFIVNELLTSRLWFGNILYNDLGIPPLLHGVNIEQYLPIDFYFIQTIYSLGIIPFTVLFYITLKKLITTPLTLFMAFSILIMLLETMTETYFSVPFYSISLFIIFSKKQNEK